MKNKIKVIIAIFSLIIASIIMLNSKEKEIATVKSETTELSTIEVKKGTTIYQNNNEIIETAEDKNIVAKIKPTKDVTLETKDIDKPNNVETISNKVYDNTIIVKYDKPEDIGTNYTYTVKDKNEAKEINFYSKSGILGYNYMINNDEKVDENAIGINPNKIDETPLVIENIDFEKKYYLHIRTIDNNYNYSGVKTIKIDIPSNGVNIQYLDLNGKQLYSDEKINGMIGDSYNVLGFEKDVDRYVLTNIDGNTSGILKREKMNVKYEYSPKATYTVKFVDKNTEEQILAEKTIEGYIGKKEKFQVPKIKNYIVPSTNVELNYSNLENCVTVEYDKDVQTVNENPIKPIETVENKSYITIKYVDIDTDKVISVDTLEGINGSKVKLKVKRIEGYKCMSNIHDSNNDDESIMDEIINSLSDNENTSKNTQNANKIKNESIKEQYEIVMNCDNSDYIIYYKKQ